MKGGELIVQRFGRPFGDTKRRKVSSPTQKLAQGDGACRVPPAVCWVDLRFLAVIGASAALPDVAPQPPWPTRGARIQFSDGIQFLPRIRFLLGIQFPTRDPIFPPDPIFRLSKGIVTFPLEF